MQESIEPRWAEAAPEAAHGIPAALRGPLRQALTEEVLRLASSGLAPSGPRFIEVLHAFTARCSPRDATAAQLRAVATFMVGLMHLNENARAPGFLDAVRAFSAGVEGTAAPHPLGRLGADLHRQLGELAAPGEQHAFAHALWETLSACVWEVEHLDAWPRTLEQYEILRHRTIGVQPFLELWKVIGGFTRAEQLQVSTPLAELEAHSRRAQFLANDLASLHRDLERRQRNSILIDAEERGVPLEEAVRRIRGLVEAASDQLARGLAALRALGLGRQRLDWYLGVIEGCTTGNALAMRDLASRYRSV